MFSWRDKDFEVKSSRSFDLTSENIGHTSYLQRNKTKSLGDLLKPAKEDNDKVSDLAAYHKRQRIAQLAFRRENTVRRNSTLSGIDADKEWLDMRNTQLVDKTEYEKFASRRKPSSSAGKKSKKTYSPRSSTEFSLTHPVGGKVYPVFYNDGSPPKILPCAHLLCRDCLVSWVKSEADALCPLCRCAILDPKERGSKSCEEVADGLPTDLAMAALVNSSRTLREDHTCKSCLNSPAVSICLNCDDMLCQACVTMHGRLSGTRDHTVEQLKSLTAERLTASRPAPCTTHSNKTSELYCPTHGACICHLCAASKHRACPEVTELEEKVAEAREVLSDLAATLSARESELERAMTKLDQQLIQTEKTTQTTLADIDAACNRLQSSVEACRRRLKELALSTKSKVAEAVSCGKRILSERRGKLTSHKRLVQRVKMTSPRSSVGEMATSLKSLASGLDRSTSLPENAKVITKAALTIDPHALARIEKELAELGKVNTVAASLVTQPAASSVLRFHANHGRNITLSNDSQTAKRTGEYWYGLVVSREPMVVNTLYQVRLEDVDERYSADEIFVGVVTIDPATQSFSDVLNALDLSSAYIISDTFVRYPDEEKVSSDVGAALCSVGVGDSVGVVVDAARCLHLYINGQDQGVAGHDVPQPCFAFFDLFLYWEKVTGLPITTIK
nr:hypothetical protein BaRGS_015255 [Batillaria attramentaria]